MFIKNARVPIIALAEGRFSPSTDGLLFKRRASVKTASFYQENAQQLDIKTALALTASEYDISNDPKDYIFEAVRAVTAEIPNENGDGFPRNELLRFDHRLGKAVYQTFIGKPHQINHRADNPKTARGVVLDASYNDLSPAMENCPACNNRTASPEGRDSIGINCIKCGTTVKDEFVELLLAIDTRKDPTFADGVRTGALDSLSMGCEAGYTDCSICDNRARSAAQFCEHIRGGNKKKSFKTASGQERMAFEKCGDVVFTEISRVDQPADPKAKQQEVLKIAGLPLAVESEMLIMNARLAKLEQMSKIAQVAKGYYYGPAEELYWNDGKDNWSEWSDQSNSWSPIDLDESDTDLFPVGNAGGLPRPPSSPPFIGQAQAQPGDPEVVPQVPFKNIAESIRWAESSIHKLKAEMRRLASEKNNKQREAAGSSRPFYAWESATYDAQIKANRQFVSRLEDYVTKAREMQAAGTPWEKGLTRQMSRFFASKEGQAIDEVRQQTDQLEQLKVMHPEMTQQIDQLSGQSDVPEPMSIDDYTKKHEESFDQNMTLGEMGMKPDDQSGLALPVNVSAGKAIDEKIAADFDALIDTVKENNVGATQDFADSYKHLEATVTGTGNVKVHTAAGTLFVVRPTNRPTTKEAAAEVAREVLASIASDGLVGAVAKYDAIVGPKAAQVLEHHLEDFAGGREKGDTKGMPEGGLVDHQDDRSKPEKSMVGEEYTDRKDETREHRDQSNSDVLEKHQPDHKESLPSGLIPMTEKEYSDMADGHGRPSKTTLKHTMVDFKDKQPKSARAPISRLAQSTSPTLLSFKANDQFAIYEFSDGTKLFEDSVGGGAVLVKSDGTREELYGVTDSLYDTVIVNTKIQKQPITPADEQELDTVFGFDDKQPKGASKRAQALQVVDFSVNDDYDSVVTFSDGTTCKGNEEGGRWMEFDGPLGHQEYNARTGTTLDGKPGQYNQHYKMIMKSYETHGGPGYLPGIKQPKGANKRAQVANGGKYLIDSDGEVYIISNGKYWIWDEAHVSWMGPYLDDHSKDWESMQSTDQFPEDPVDIDHRRSGPPSDPDGFSNKISMDVCANEMCSMHSSKKGAGDDCSCAPNCGCQCGCKCAGSHKAQGVPNAPAVPGQQPSIQQPSIQQPGMVAPLTQPMAPLTQPMAPTANKQARLDDSAKKYMSRVERLYKNRLAQSEATAKDQYVKARSVAVKDVTARILRALHLVAKRQQLNLEESAIKSAMFDVLTRQADLDADTFYPGMDESTAAHIVEATSNEGLGKFVDSLLKRASEFMDMNEDALTALENDIKHLRPMAVNVQASAVRVASRQDIRKQAANGNLVIAPTATESSISRNGSRDTIRSALGSTKVSRTSKFVSSNKG